MAFFTLLHDGVLLRGHDVIRQDVLLQIHVCGELHDQRGKSMSTVDNSSAVSQETTADRPTVGQNSVTQPQQSGGS